MRIVFIQMEGDIQGCSYGVIQGPNGPCGITSNEVRGGGTHNWVHFQP